MAERKQRAAVPTIPWRIEFNLCGHAYKVTKVESLPGGARREWHEILDDSYGLTIREGRTAVLHMTFAVPPGGDPKQSEVYRRAVAICSFGAAVQNMLATNAATTP